MNKTDWMKHHGFDFMDMHRIVVALWVFNGSIVAIVENFMRRLLRP